MIHFKCNILFVSGFLFIVMSSCVETDLKTNTGDLKAMNVFGDVRSICEKEYEVPLNCTSSKVNDLKEVDVTYKIYNNDGFIIEYRKSCNGENALEKILYTYDNNLKTELVITDSTGKTESRIEWKYNNKGKLVSRIQNGWHNNKTICVYNEMGLKTEESIYESGELKKKSIFKYDVKDILRKELIYKGGALNSIIEYISPSMKDNIEDSLLLMYNNKGELVYRHVYNKNRKTKKVDWYGSLNCNSVYKYDKNDNLFKVCSFFESSNDSTITTYKYDKYNNTLESIKRDTDGKIIKIFYKYNYDKVGNWIELKEYNNDKLVELKTRDITYY